MKALLKRGELARKGKYMDEIDKGRIRDRLQSLQRKVPRLCRYSFERAFDVAMAIENQRGVEERKSVLERLNTKWSRKDEATFLQMQESTAKRVAYLQALQKEALEIYDGEKERQTREKSNSRSFTSEEGVESSRCESEPAGKS